MRTDMWQRAIALFAGVMGFALAGQGQEALHLASADCTALREFRIPASAIGLPTSGGVVQTAVTVGASEQGNINGEFCKVVGIVRPKNPASPNLEFEVNLPLS